MAALDEDAPLIAVTSRMTEASALVNRVEVKKFPFLLTRIIKKLHLREEQIFSEAEEEQLREMFGLSDAELRTLLEGLSYVFEQAAYHTIRPAALSPLIMKAGMDEAHASCIASVWEEEATGLVTKLKEHTMSGPRTLTGSQYRLHLQMGASKLTRLQHPCALFELSLGSGSSSSSGGGGGGGSSSSSGGGGGGGKRSSSNNDGIVDANEEEEENDSGAKNADGEKVAVEFNHAELYDFFLKLEKMQEQIDALS